MKHRYEDLHGEVAQALFLIFLAQRRKGRPVLHAFRRAGAAQFPGDLVLDFRGSNREFDPDGEQRTSGLKPSGFGAFMQR